MNPGKKKKKKNKAKGVWNEGYAADVELGSLAGGEKAIVQKESKPPGEHGN